MNIKKLINALFFPQKCVFCNKIIGADKYACPKCNIDNYKTHWVVLFPLGTDTKSRNKRYFDAAYAAYYYKNEVKNAISALKFKKRRYAAQAFAKYMANNIKRIVKEDAVIMPVPISKNRMDERGYNQAEILCENIIEYVDYEYDNKAIIKVKDNKAQTKTKNDRERAANVKGCYKCIKDIDKKTIILIDDVITTGATVNEISKELKSKGAEKVYVFAAACTFKK